MPIYEYICECGCELEVFQEMGGEAPVCPECGGAMRRGCGSIAILNVKTAGITPHSKGYKEGYKKEYLKSTNREAWKGTIIEPQAQG